MRHVFVQIEEGRLIPDLFLLFKKCFEIIASSQHLDIIYMEIYMVVLNLHKQ